MLKYQLVKSNKRKTLGLQVKQGKIIVRAPSFLSDLQIEQLVQNKSAWLLDKIAKHNSLPVIPGISFQQGSTIWIQGERKKLTIIVANKSQVTILKDELCVEVSYRNKKALKIVSQEDKSSRVGD